MKAKLFLNVILFVVLFVPLLVAAQTSEFTYQGRLTDGGMPPTANYDFEFRLYDANNNLLGTQTRLGVPVSNGAFTATLDYGSSPNPFTGEARLLEIAVRPAGGGAYTTLNPRQPITSSPYSIHSREATTADLATDSTQLGGVPAARFVQSDAAGNVSVGGNLTVGGSLTQPIVNATTEYQIGGQRVFRIIDAFGTTIVGLNAGVNTTNAGNSFFGAESGMATTTGGDNSYFGLRAGQTGTTNFNNSFFGVDAGRNNTANDNSFFGRSAGFDNTTGTFNAFFGLDAGRFNTTGSSNSFFGRSAGFDNTTGSGNSFFGFDAGRFNTTGLQNSFFGTLAGRNTTTAFSNAFFGSSAGRDNTTGNANSIFGALAGTGNITGNHNSYFGHLAGNTNTEGESNSIFGSNAGRFNTAGNNSFFGASAGNANTTGAGNSFFGLNAGNTNTMGSNNTVVGNNGDVGADNLSFATALGAGSVVNTSNTVVLGRSADTVQIPGNLNLAGSFTGNITVPAANITGVLGVSNGGTNLSSPGAGGNFLRSNGSTWTSSPIQVSDLPNLGGSFIQNTTNEQTSANFNIDGEGTLGTLYVLGSAQVNQQLTANNLSANFSISAGQTVSTNLLEANRVRAIGKIEVTVLGTAGSTQLCRNASNEISTCASSLTGSTTEAPLDSAKNQQTQIQTHQDQIQKQNAQIEAQQKQLLQQQSVIDGLRKLVCSQNLQAEVCKEK